MLDAALALADESGLDAVTMQAVASRLGVTPMAIYRHVGDKGALLDGVVERLLGEVRLPSEALPWPDRLRATARGVRRIGQRHPGVFPLVLQRLVATPAALRVRDTVQRGLVDAGVDPGRTAQAERLISTAVLGFVVSEVGGRFRNHSKRTVDGDFERLLELLSGLLESERAQPARWS